MPKDYIFEEGYGINKYAVRNGEELLMSETCTPYGEELDVYIERLQKIASKYNDPFVDHRQEYYDDSYIVVVEGWQPLNDAGLKEYARRKHLYDIRRQQQALAKKDNDYKQYLILKEKYGRDEDDA